MSKKKDCYVTFGDINNKQGKYSEDDDGLAQCTVTVKDFPSLIELKDPCRLTINDTPIKNAKINWINRNDKSFTCGERVNLTSF